MKKSSDSGFISVWPTLFLHRIIPGCDAPNALLQQHVLDADAKHDSYTTDYRHQDFFSDEHPAIEWLKSCVNKTVVDYFHHQSLGYSVKWSLQAWANVNRQGDYHNLHNHPHSYLSGTYYIAVPEQTLQPSQRQDLNPGCISFFDPRAQANMNAIKGDNQIDAEHRVNPLPGMILLWPSFVHHLVHPNASTTPRISVSFNVILNRHKDYLPAN